MYGMGSNSMTAFQLLLLLLLQWDTVQKTQWFTWCQKILILTANHLKPSESHEKSSITGSTMHELRQPFQGFPC